MSTPHPPGSSADVHPTRQQLDELDDLLRRMLELPVNAAEVPAETADVQEEVPAHEPAPSAPPVSYVVVETGGGAPDPSPAAPEEAPTQGARPEPDADGWIPFRSSWQPSPQTWGPLAESWHQARTGARPAPKPVAAEAPPPPPAATPLPPPAATPVEVAASSPPPDPGTGVPPEQNEPGRTAPAAPPQSWPQPALAPLVWFNRCFDAGLAPLGAGGRWLRGRAGRTALGAAGLLCLAAAAALALGEGILPWNR